MHLVGLEPTTSLSTLLLEGKEVPFELELINHDNLSLSLSLSHTHTHNSHIIEISPTATNPFVLINSDILKMIF